jgi:hypothetical protein
VPLPEGNRATGIDASIEEMTELRMLVIAGIA